MKYKPNDYTARIRKWLGSNTKTRSEKTLRWLKERGHGRHGIVHLLHGAELAKERKEFAAEFGIH
jgi:hypothetical protein